MNKLVLPGNIINSKNAEFSEIQRANTFNLEKRPLKIFLDLINLCLCFLYGYY